MSLRESGRVGFALKETSAHPQSQQYLDSLLPELPNFLAFLTLCLSQRREKPPWTLGCLLEMSIGGCVRLGRAQLRELSMGREHS